MRHELAQASLHPDLIAKSDRLRDGLECEASGQWYLAGERFRAMGRELENVVDLQLERAKVLARAAYCLDLVGEDHDAAWSYLEAAQALRTVMHGAQVGELFNRAAARFRAAGEYFNAGFSLTCAGDAFIEMSESLLNTQDNIPPVPLHAGKFTAAATCLSAAGEEFLKTEERGWARSAYWRSGVLHRQELPCVQASIAFEQALLVCVRVDKTLDPAHLRLALPLTDEERTAKLDPVAVLEEAIRAIARSDADADEEMIRIFRSFSFELKAVGNRSESRTYYIAWRRRFESRCWNERRIATWLGHVVWRLTCLYGESLVRWSISCTAVFGLCALLFSITDGVRSAQTWTDYAYYSLVILTGLGSNDMSPNGPAGLTLVCAEVLAGILLFGLLLTFLARKVFEE